MMLAGVGPVAAASRSGPYPADTILLFVAAWCAPCRGELARLDAIADAARPRPVRVVLLDDTKAGREMLRGIDPGRRWDPDRATQRRIDADLSAATAGLPYAMLTDADGLPCADRRGTLDVGRIRLLIETCVRPR